MRQNPPFSLGSTVFHPKFGQGTVSDLTPPPTGFADEGSWKATVQFASGSRYLLSSFLSATPVAPRPRPESDKVVNLAEVRSQQRSAAIQATPFTMRDPKAIPRRAWLYGHHLIRRFVSTTVAPGGVGKSSLVITEAIAMAAGRDLLGVQPCDGLRVWLWNGEDPKDEIERRIAGVALHYNLSNEDLAGRLFVDSGRDVEIVIAEASRDGAIIARPVVEALIQTIRDNRIDVVSIDPFVSSHRVTENDNNAIDRVVKTWAQIADATGCAVELVHHVRKTGGQEVTVEDGRGASALLAAARSARVLNPMTEAEAAKAGVENRRRFFRVANGKANLAPATDASDWHEMISVQLGNGPLGMGDNVGVVAAWKMPDPFAGISAADLLKAQRTVDGGRWRENAQANDWVGKPVCAALGLDHTNKAHKARVANLLKTWIANGAFVKVDGLDDARRPKTFVEVGEWANIA